MSVAFPTWEDKDHGVQLYLGDCLEVLPTLEPGSVDAVVTDPPYGLGFMGKDWDHGIPGSHFWEAVLTVAKPGAHLLAFGGTRTFHRLACAIEDAGWEIRDCIMWVYGSGFPKSEDASKAIDRQACREELTANLGRKPTREEFKAEWENYRKIVGTKLGLPGYSLTNATDQGNTLGWSKSKRDGAKECSISTPFASAAAQWSGWGTALKPAWEPVIVARKPLDGTVADNVQRYGTGAMNIDGCRVRGGSSDGGSISGLSALGQGSGWNAHTNRTTAIDRSMGKGRWPANLIHDGSEEAVAGFPQTGMSAGGRSGHTAAYSGGYKQEYYGNEHPGFGDSGSAARFFYCAKASRTDRNEGLGGFQEKPLNWSSGTKSPETFQAEGTKRRAKNHHPTVKPTALMQYLCRLVTQPGGIILDPFMGSGSTGRAAMLEGFRFVGIDNDPECLPMARARIRAAIVDHKTDMFRQAEVEQPTLFESED